MYQHHTVLKKELVEALSPAPGTCAIDCTLGGGGHTEGLLRHVGKDGLVIAIDRDRNAIENAKTRFSSEIAANRLRLVHAPFSQVKEAISSQNPSVPISAVCADIGVSSVHLDDESRGFSFRHDGPLDMRMDQDSDGETAESIVNTWSVDDLTKLLRDYGEEPRARAIASGIAREREQNRITTTHALAKVVERSARYNTPSKKHVATRTFQALRIAVNDELGELEKLLHGGFDVLSKHGKLAIITFHSLEDRMVKSHFVSLSSRAKSRQVPKGMPMTEEELARFQEAPGLILKPFPICPSDEEVEGNPRARSAKLRVIEKIIS